MANGEASDWMLGERGIYAASVELGGEVPETKTWFIEDTDALKSLLVDNHKWLGATMGYLEAVIECEGFDTVITAQDAEDADVDVVAVTVFQCVNHGLKNSEPAVYRLSQSPRLPLDTNHTLQLVGTVDSLGVSSTSAQMEDLKNCDATTASCLF